MGQMMGIRIYRYGRIPTPYNVFASSLTRGMAYDCRGYYCDYCVAGYYDSSGTVGDETTTCVSCASNFGATCSECNSGGCTANGCAGDFYVNGGTCTACTGTCTGATYEFTTCTVSTNRVCTSCSDTGFGSACSECTSAGCTVNGCNNTNGFYLIGS